MPIRDRDGKKVNPYPNTHVFKLLRCVIKFAIDMIKKSMEGKVKYLARNISAVTTC